MSMKIGKKIAAGVLPICSETGRLLIIKRGPEQSDPGKWSCFFGKFDEEVDKNPKDTAKREFVEESRYIGRYKISKTPLYVTQDNHKNTYTYVGIFDSEFTPDLTIEKEATEYRWVSLNEMPSELVSKFKETIENKKRTIENIICFYAGKC